MIGLMMVSVTEVQFRVLPTLYLQHLLIILCSRLSHYRKSLQGIDMAESDTSALDCLLFATS